MLAESCFSLSASIFLHARELRKNLSSYWKSPFLLLIIIPFHHIVNFPSGFDLLTIVKFALCLTMKYRKSPATRCDCLSLIRDMNPGSRLG